MTQENTAEAVVEPAQAEPEKPTIEELTTRLAQYEKDLTSARNEAKAHQKFGQEKVAELNKQADLRGEIASIREDLELAVTAFALRPSGDEITPDNEAVKNTLAELAKKRDAREAGRKERELALARQEYNQRADAIYTLAQKLFGEGQEEKLEDIEDLLKSGNIVRAEQRIARASKTTVAKTETPKESEEDKIARLVKEKLVRDYPQMYASDTGSPGGSALVGWAEIERQYGAGEITTEVYSQARKKQGIS